jgi:hypothetical protein
MEFLICLHSNAINILFLAPTNASVNVPFLGILFFAVNSAFSLSCQAMMNASSSSHFKLANISRVQRTKNLISAEAYQKQDETINR